MTLSLALAIYVVIWWTVLFAILPWGVRSQHEEGTVVPGSEPGAPTRPRLLMKAIATTLVSCVIFVLVYWLVAYRPIGFDDIPFLPRSNLP